MIVAEKELKIEGGYAPDLNMKMGEVNRQYILIPPFDISSYSVRSEIVKPDNTFVYTDQAINTDGNILLTLPEQAGAVAGYGHYIIKIYDLNTIVYSAVGNLRIDDHLILDGMIESVAEVNGYTFPDDFMMKDDLNAIFDDTTVSNETGWTSTKIEDYVDNYVNYTTSERVVGKWIDGKPLYEKTYHVNTITSTYTTIDNTINISTVKIRDVSMGTLVVGGYYYNAQYVDGRLSYNSFVRVILHPDQGLVIGMENPPGDPLTDFDFTIRYTKTTD